MIDGSTEEDTETDGESDTVLRGESEGVNVTDGDAVVSGLVLVEADGDIDSDPEAVPVPEDVVEGEPVARTEGEGLTETLGEDVVEGETSGDALKTPLSVATTLPVGHTDTVSAAVDEADIEGEIESLDDPEEVLDVSGVNDAALLLE